MTNQATSTISINAGDEVHTIGISWIWLSAWAGLTGLIGFEIVSNGLIDGSPLFAATLLVAAFGAFIGPDLAFLIGIGDQVEKGSMSTRAVPFYNAAHRMSTAAIFTAAVAAGLGTQGRFSLVTLVAGLSWMAHIAVDRAVGYGLRNPDGTRSQH